MATVLRMPGVSADANEAALVEWAISPGDSVKRGDVVATVETEKAVVDLEAEEDGILFKTLAAAGESVTIGGPIAVFAQSGEEVDETVVLAGLGLGPQASGPLSGAEEERSQDALLPGAEEATYAPAAVATVHGNGSGPASGRIFATPLVRRLAAEAGVALEAITGSGPGGRIRRRDLAAVLAQRQAPTLAPAAEAGSAAPVADAAPTEPAASGQSPSPALPRPTPAAPAATGGFTDIPHSRFRRAVATALTASKQSVPHFYLKATCRAEALLELRERVNAQGGTKVTINDLVVKAAALALVEVPEMNVIWTQDAVRRFESVDIAVAMATERGLLTPVVRSVQSSSLSSLSATIKDLAVRGGEGRLKQQELEGGSLTVSNLGMFGTEEFAAIINPPQVGILAVGAVIPQAVEDEDGGLALGRCMTVVLSVDHRPVDGAIAAQWLRSFKQLVENPFRLLV